MNSTSQIFESSSIHSFSNPTNKSISFLNVLMPSFCWCGSLDGSMNRCFPDRPQVRDHITVSPNGLSFSAKKRKSGAPKLWSLPPKKKRKWIKSRELVHFEISHRAYLPILGLRVVGYHLGALAEYYYDEYSMRRAFKATCFVHPCVQK